MDRQTLRDWVHRYNAEGLVGLRDRKAPGRAAKLTPEQTQQLAALVEDACRAHRPPPHRTFRWIDAQQVPDGQADGVIPKLAPGVRGLALQFQQPDGAL